MNILIINKYRFHYEIIETIILKYKLIIGKLVKKCNIYLRINISNKSFFKYIIKKYPYIKVLFKMNNIKYDFIIDCSFDGNINKIINDNKHYYISHRVKTDLLKYKNIYYLTPLNNNNYLYADILPFIDKKIKSAVPIFCIQGCLDNKKRDYNLLKKILGIDYKYKYIIKLIGYGDFPKELLNYKNKIKFKNNLNFIDYHKEFIDVYSIIPLISYERNKSYYKNQLTSSISYGIGYNLKFLIDKNLQRIYNLKNVYVYNNINDICDRFNNILTDFYNN
jgi:hypothetical protein